MRILQVTQLISLMVAPLLITACGSGGDTVALDNTNPIQQLTYTGPVPQNEDVANFKLNVWDNLSATNRCGQCHGTDGQSPTFVQSDDVNLAYDQVNPFVNLNTPNESILATKVGGGHNCWESSNTACADIITAYINAWAGGSSSASNTIQLVAPTLRDPGSSKSFPEDSALFQSTVYPIVRTYCAECHSDDAAFAQKPFFASADVDAAYDAVRNKIDLDSPASSRMVVRLSSEFHNCWGSCSANGDEMLAAVRSFSDAITPTAIAPELVVSKSLRLTDGIVASSGGRYESNVIALYEFKTGQGVTAFDTSGVEPSMNLTLSGSVDWVGGYGIRIEDGKAQATTTASKKLRDKIVSTGEYAIEAWVAPANVTQEGPARIVSYSAGTMARNFTLGQTLYNYDFLHRSSTTDGDGQPALSTDDAAEVLQATLQHVVVTYSAINGRRIYVNGEFTGDLDEIEGGNLNDWDDTFAFVLGNEVSSDRLWQGVIRLVAIHNRELTAEQVLQNFDVGVGERFFLLFSISDVIGVNESYVVFEVSQFDSYSYLFSEPFAVTLDSTATFSNIPVEGIRIGINGKIPTVGQAFSGLNTQINSAQFAEGRQILSPLGTVLAIDKGSDSDEFFLSFERLGDQDNVIIEALPPPNATPADLPDRPQIGLRTFDEINYTMSNVTGVPITHAAVTQTFNTVKQQLPTIEDIDSFLSAQQMAITQLAIEYCNALVEDTSLRATYFNNFNFTASPSTAFNQAGKDTVINALLDRMLGSNLTSQPDIEGSDGVRNELENLIDGLAGCGVNCAADRTATITKATCAAVLGSAVVIVQ
ncbi:MAG: LamG domain-containing protein [Pseudomonadota bacterium]